MCVCVCVYVCLCVCLFVYICVCVCVCVCCADQDKEETALHMACSGRHVAIAELLLDHHADPNTTRHYLQQVFICVCVVLCV